MIRVRVAAHTMNVLVRSASVLALVATALAANAALVDFENLANTSGTITDHGTSVTSGGFTFATGGNSYFSSIGANSGLNYTGSVALFLNGVPGTISVNQVGGGAFTLASLQVANFGGGVSDGATYTFTGQKAGGGSVAQSYTLLPGNALQTVSLANFTSLSSVTVGLSGFAQFDNFVVAVNPTPEPATFAALGLGAVAMLRRRKRA